MTDEHEMTMKDGFTENEVDTLMPASGSSLVGSSPNMDELRKTFDRRLSYWLESVEGYGSPVLENLRNGKGVFPNPGGDQLIIVRHIPFYSLCEHHLAPFFGVASVGYLPDETLIGLSKINRVVDAFARRLQVQERLTRQVSEFLHEVLQASGVAVRVEARHMCMESRGVRHQGQTTITTALQGKLRGRKAQQEFVAAVQVPLPNHL